MKYYKYILTLSEGVNPYNTHAITTHLFGKDGAVDFSASSKGQSLLIKSAVPANIPDGKISIDHYGRRCIAYLEDFSVEETKDLPGEFLIDAELSYGRKTKDSVFCPVWSKGFCHESLLKIMESSGLRLVSVEKAIPGTAVTDKKVHIYNIFTLRARVTVSDVKKWEKAQVRGIGQRKSYGFGLIAVVDEKAV